MPTVCSTTDVLRYWMTEYKFDGFRFDLVKGLGDNDSYANSGDNATNSYNASRVARMRELQKVVEEINPNAYFINENLAGSKEENEMAATGQLNWANINNAGCQFAMGYSSESDMNRFYAPKDGGRLWGSTVSYLESHDEQRLAYKQNQWGVAEIKGKLEPSMARLGSAAAQMILAPGAHMIWQFSEIGNSQNTKNSDGGNNTDPKIVNWAQFEEAPCKGLYDSYCELIGIRNLNRELFAEDATFEINCGTSSWANGRTLVSKNGSTELYTVVNPNVDNQLTVMVNFDKSDNSFYHILSKSYGSEPSFSASSKTVTVPANCYVVIGSMDVSSVESVSDGIFSGLLRAYSVAGEIMVDSSPSRVVVYGADGRMAGSLEEGERLAVSPGVYVLRAAGETLKIVVR